MYLYLLLFILGDNMTLQRFEKDCLGRMQLTKEGEWVKYSNTITLIDEFRKLSSEARHREVRARKSYIQISIEKNDLKEQHRKRLIVLTMAIVSISLSFLFFC